MAFPDIPQITAPATASILSHADTTSPRSFGPFSDLASIGAGDLLIAIIVAYQTTAASNAAFSSWDSGFTEFFDSSSSTTMAIGAAYKFASGSESGSLTVAQAATISGHCNTFLLQITNAHASTPPEAGGRASGTSTAADPTSISPSWGADDTLWISVMGGGEDGTGGAFSGVGTTPPTNYGSILNSPTTSDVVGGTQALLSFRQLNAASEDVGPGGSVDVSNARNAAAVIAVRPVAAAPPALVLEQGYVNFNDPGVYMQADEPRGIRRAWHPRRSGIFVPEYAI